MLGFKKKVAADIVGRNLTLHLIDADDCWRAVCMLRAYDVPGPVATCEMAFARAALVRSLFSELPDAPGIRERLQLASDEVFAETFNAEEDTEEVREHYGMSLAKAAGMARRFYGEHVFPCSQLAAVMGIRLGVPGIPSVEAGPLFEAVVTRFEKLTSEIKII